MTQPRTLSTASAAGIAVDNPATGEVIGQVPDSPAEQVAAAVARARRAQPGWAQLTARDRAKLLTRARHWLLDHSQQVVDSIVTENGKAAEDAIVEIVYCVSAFAYWAKRGPRGYGRLRHDQRRSGQLHGSGPVRRIPP